MHSRTRHVRFEEQVGDTDIHFPRVRTFQEPWPFARAAYKICNLRNFVVADAEAPKFFQLKVRSLTHDVSNGQANQKHDDGASCHSRLDPVESYRLPRRSPTIRRFSILSSADRGRELRGDADD